MIANKIFILNLLLLTTPFILQGENGKVETIGTFRDSIASESVRNALEQKGYRVIRDNGHVICEIWFRDGIPVQKKTNVLGAIYTELSESIFVGVLFFPKGGSDYKGQSIKPGAYTMRYELLPNDGNHLGVAPIRDFLLLIPVAVDSVVEAQFDYDTLVMLSTKTSETNHPATFNMTYPESEENLPTVFETFEGHVVLTVNLRTQVGNRIVLALVLEGEAEQ